MTPSQELARDILEETALLKHLAPFNPVFIGTIPIDIDIPGSDIDIACEVYDTNAFHNALPADATISATNPLLAHITTHKLPIEIYGEPIPVTEQRGYIHMVVEERLLSLGGETLRQKVRALKTKGLKTEPAFAKLLNLPGDPYIALLDLANATTTQLKELLKTIL